MIILICFFEVYGESESWKLVFKFENFDRPGEPYNGFTRTYLKLIFSGALIIIQALINIFAKPSNDPIEGISKLDCL